MLILGVVVMIILAISNPESDLIAGLIMLFLVLIYVFLIVFGTVITVWMIVDCALRKFKDENQKILWVILIALVGTVPAIIYYYLYGKHAR